MQETELDPDDLIPDRVPGLGYLDDAADGRLGDLSYPVFLCHLPEERCRELHQHTTAITCLAISGNSATMCHTG